MPQFDSTFFPSQIFWLVICFAILYLAMSKIYLPRITAILRDRKETIEHNSLISQQLHQKINQISESTASTRNSAFIQYQTALDQATKEASLRREKALSDLRKKTEHLTEEATQNISKFIETSKDNSEGVIKNLVNLLSKKIFTDHNSGTASINHIGE